VEQDPTAMEPEEEDTGSVEQPVGQTDVPGDLREHEAVDEGAVASPDDDEADKEGDPEEEDEIEVGDDETPPEPAEGDDEDDEEPEE
jgi:hypothetical protein